MLHSSSAILSSRHKAGRMSGGWPESLIDITDAIADETGDLSLTLRIVRRLARDFGGEQIYIPSPETVDRPARDAEIRRVYDGTFDGRNGIRALAARYNLSLKRIYRIVRSD